VTVTYDDISRITADYMFSDRDRVIDMLRCILWSGDEDTFKYFVTQCESRDIDLGELFIEAEKKRSDILNAVRSGVSISGGNKIQVPFSYAVKDKS